MSFLASNSTSSNSTSSVQIPDWLRTIYFFNCDQDKDESYAKCGFDHMFALINFVLAMLAFYQVYFVYHKCYQVPILCKCCR